MRFGRLINNRIEYAKNVVKIGNVLYSNPSEEVYLEAGYKKVVDDKIENEVGYAVVFDSYTEDNDSIHINYKRVEMHPEPKTGFQISKLSLRLALLKLGIWEKVEEWMHSFEIDLGNGVSINCFEAWQEALVIDTSDPLFQPYLQKAKEKFAELMTEEQIDALLKQCRAK